MLSYCLKCRTNRESKNLKVVRTKNERIMLLSKCSVSNSKNLKFIISYRIIKYLRNKSTFQSNSFVRSSFVLKA